MALKFFNIPRAKIRCLTVVVIPASLLSSPLGNKGRFDLGREVPVRNHGFVSSDLSDMLGSDITKLSWGNRLKGRRVFKNSRRLQEIPHTISARCSLNRLLSFTGDQAGL